MVTPDWPENVLLDILLSLYICCCLFLGVTLSSEDIWKTLNDLSQNDLPFTSDLKIEPTLFGERHAPDVRASIANMTSSNMSLWSVWNSLCGSLVSNLQTMMSREQVREAGVQRIVVSGRVASRNDVIRHAIEREFQLPVVMADDAQADAAMGAAMATIRFSHKEDH